MIWKIIKTVLYAIFDVANIVLINFGDAFKEKAIVDKNKLGEKVLDLARTYVPIAKDMFSTDNGEVKKNFVEGNIKKDLSSIGIQNVDKLVSAKVQQAYDEMKATNTTKEDKPATVSDEEKK